MKVSEEDFGTIINHFDRDGRGWISYEDFLHALTGEMSDFRRGLAYNAFSKLDVEGSGLVDKNSVTQAFDPSQHPDVQEGRGSEETVLTEFLDTFEMHSSLLHPGQYNHKVSYDEFCDYYNNVSAGIEDDGWFEAMMVNVWKL